jgi:hypothetical protein
LFIPSRHRFDSDERNEGWLSRVFRCVLTPHEPRTGRHGCTKSAVVHTTTTTTTTTAAAARTLAAQHKKVTQTGGWRCFSHRLTGTCIDFMGTQRARFKRISSCTFKLPAAARHAAAPRPPPRRSSRGARAAHQPLRCLYTIRHRPHDFRSACRGMSHHVCRTLPPHNRSAHTGTTKTKTQRGEGKGAFAPRRSLGPPECAGSGIRSPKAQLQGGPWSPGNTGQREGEIAFRETTVCMVAMCIMCVASVAAK